MKREDTAMTPEERNAMIERAQLWVTEFGPEAAGYVGDLSPLNDVQLRARVDAIADSPLQRWKRDKLAADLVASGDRSEREEQYHRTGRVDGPMPPTAMASALRVVWPEGFDRDSALAELRAVGLYTREMKASDVWIAGALMRLLEIGWSKGMTLSAIVAELNAAGVTTTAIGQPLADAPIGHVLAAYKSLRARQEIRSGATPGGVRGDEAIEPTEADRRAAELQLQTHRGNASPDAYQRMVDNEARRIARKRGA